MRADIGSNLCPRPLVARAKSGNAGCDDAKLDLEEAPVPIRYATVREVFGQSLEVQDGSDGAARACSDPCNQLLHVTDRSAAELHYTKTHQHRQANLGPESHLQFPQYPDRKGGEGEV